MIDADKDIYFTPEWSIVNQYIEEGAPKLFELWSEFGVVRYRFILREIHIGASEELYDITSPYGYGGPVVVRCEPGYEKALLLEYEKKFGEYCRENNIVSEFVRFHPIAENGVAFREVYRPEFNRHTVGTDLTADDPIAAEFSKSCRKSIRRALKEGVTWRVVERPDEVDDFIKIYYSTMNRDNASDFYYFPKEYFERCAQLFEDRLILVEAIYQEKVIAAGFYFCSGGIIHAHLSGTLQEYINLSPAYVIKYATAVWGKEHGFLLIHYGGGVTGDIEDSLYRFKRKFTKNTIFDFYIGKKVWNQKMYHHLIRLKEKEIGHEITTNFFPTYRGG